MIFNLFIVLLMCPVINAIEDSGLLIERLKKTRLHNSFEVIQNLNLINTDYRNSSFLLSDPYKFEDHENDHQQVCAVKFIKNTTDYILKTFKNESEMTDGFVITHFNHCGACSSLNDLSVYIQYPDLTSVGRKCSRVRGMKEKKNCYVQEVGFSQVCAEAWAYNSKNTKSECKKTCIRDYGLIPLLRNAPSTFVDNLPGGELRPCIECDEIKSGPGFKYSSGRTRRNSGLKSSINRSSEEVLSVDHSLYFK